MQKVKRELEVNANDFYKIYLDSLPLALKMTARQREVLAVLLSLKHDNIPLGSKNRLIIARSLGMTYQNLASVLNNMKDLGIIEGFDKGIVKSKYYIPKYNTEISTSIKIS